MVSGERSSFLGATFCKASLSPGVGGGLLALVTCASASLRLLEPSGGGLCCCGAGFGITGGKYGFLIIAPDYKQAEKTLDQANQFLTQKLAKEGSFSFKRKDD